MTRLIDADALHDDLRAKQKWIVKRDDKHNEGYTYDQVHFAIDEQPTVDAVPVKHGRFIGTEYDGYADGNPVYYEWKCSECGCVFEDEEPTYNYSPNCAARMEKPE